jgi:DNA repair photolyase
MDRLRLLREFSKCGICTGVLMMPIIPYLTDNIENLEGIFKTAKENGAKFIIPQVLHLRGDTKKVFFGYIHELFPESEEKIKSLYSSGAYVEKKYLDAFRQKIIFLRRKYNFFNESHKSECHRREQQNLQLKLL